MKLLKQSTAVTVKVGPFLDSTDGVTAETALTLSQSDCILFKNNGAGAQKNDTSSATHDTGGVYGVPLNTTDTGTLGPLKLLINESGALPVWEEWMVVAANIYDSLVGNSDKLQVDVVELSGSATQGTRLERSMSVCPVCTVTNAGFSPTTSEFETADITEATATHYIGRQVIFLSGALKDQASRVTAYTLSGGRGHFTVETMTDAPANGDTFQLF